MISHTSSYVHWFARVPPGTIVEHPFTVNLVIRGYHVNKDGWNTLIIGEVLYCEREIENYNDPMHPIGLYSGSEKR